MKQLLLMLVLLVSSVTNAQTFLFSCGAPELIQGRTEQLDALADTALYTHVETGFIPNTDEYEVIVIRTNLDGTETEYFNNSLSWTYLGNLDGDVQGGWNGFYADAQQAVADSEADGKAEFKAFTASRTLEIEDLSSSSVSVTTEWDNVKGHVITVGGVEILSSDYGHRNYGKSSQADFESLLRRISEVVVIENPDFERNNRIQAAKNLATGETTVSHHVDGDDDVFTISFIGAGEDGSDPWTRKVTFTDPIETLDYEYTLIYFDNIEEFVIDAQAEYDARNITQRGMADLANSLFSQSQADVTEESREAEIAKLAIAGKILISMSTNSSGSHQTVVNIYYNSAGEFVGTNANSNTYPEAVDFGGQGDLALMDVEDFNDYYAAIWIFIDNNY